ERRCFSFERNAEVAAADLVQWLHVTPEAACLSAGRLPHVRDVNQQLSPGVIDDIGRASEHDYIWRRFGLDRRGELLWKLRVLHPPVFDLGVVGCAPLLDLIAEELVAFGSERLPAPDGDLTAIGLTGSRTATRRRSSRGRRGRRRRRWLGARGHQE